MAFIIAWSDRAARRGAAQHAKSGGRKLFKLALPTLLSIKFVNSVGEFSLDRRGIDSQSSSHQCKEHDSLGRTRMTSPVEPPDRYFFVYSHDVDSFVQVRM